jgi:hypothetical protein
MEIENCNRSLKYFVAFPHCYPPKKPSRCALEKIHVPLEAIRFQPARFHTRSFGFGHFQNRYTRSDAGTLSGPLEPTVTGMLIVRYYQNGRFAAPSSFHRSVILEPCMPPVTSSRRRCFACRSTGDTVFGTSKQKKTHLPVQLWRWDSAPLN